ncbi:MULTISPECIES: hypothetical protein [Paracoccus]|uniref:Uncharacterized protein n=1 Tax=Paracoccus litorisediminis TaxID=2006130 RepID=A0A844HVW9_9RHOB|nr:MULTISPECIES: hypothetical protein [Paracoccus]MBD9529583.1 hypothetical protein [Paracoccus sp. PAR01]MTH62477.1 hypothetical protein [Paracoccus litorisediminis]
MATKNLDQRRIAQPVQGLAGSDGQVWLYSWNTGELSVLELPVGMAFDPRADLPTVAAVDLTLG